MFICLETEEKDEKKLQCLTPTIMQLEKNIWIFDMTPTLAYWTRLAEHSQKKLFTLWREILRAQFDVTPHADVTSLPHIRATFAEQPFPAVLLLMLMRERGLRGILSHHSAIAQDLWSKGSWPLWFEVVEKCSDFKKELRSVKDRFLRALSRIHVSSLAQASLLPSSQIARRFGTPLRLAWENTLSPQLNTYFPWNTFVFSHLPTQERHLEYLTTQWSEIAPYLQEDFDALSQQCDPDEQIMSIQWILSLDDHTSYELKIPFHHPHSLHKEKGHQTTVLLQAQYQFDDFILRNQQKIQNLEFVSRIVSWKITLTETFYAQNSFLDLFGCKSVNGSSIDALLELENELPIPLRHYGNEIHWTPECSFSEDHTPHPYSFSVTLNHLAKNRPLFILGKPKEMEEELSQPTFLEAVMQPWWHYENSFERSYFKAKHDNKALWLYRNNTGTWYAHGVYA